MLCILAFLFTSGKEVREIGELILGFEPHSLGQPLFDLPIVSVMFLSFFGIAWFLLAGNARRILVGGIVLGLIYSLLSGSAAGNFRHIELLRHIIIVSMIIGIVVLLFGKKRQMRGTLIPLESTVAWASLTFIALPVILLAFGIFFGWLGMTWSLFAFLWNVTISSITSFGGGEAYVAVADSVFVQAGYCSADVLYGRIVPVSNALPGPILVKIAVAVGYVWGNESFGEYGGMLVAALCGMLTVGTCSAVALVALNYYEALKNSPFIHALKRYILPVICGTLISVSLTMLFESLKITKQYGHTPINSAGVIAFCIVVTFLVSSRVKINDLL